MTSSLSLFCPSCHKPGEIDEQDGKLLLSEGFGFDAIKVPTCEVCGVAAGVRLGECKAMLDTFGEQQKELGDFAFRTPRPRSFGPEPLRGSAKGAGRTIAVAVI